MKTPSIKMSHSAICPKISVCGVSLSQASCTVQLDPPDPFNGATVRRNAVSVFNLGSLESPEAKTVARKRIQESCIQKGQIALSIPIYLLPAAIGLYGCNCQETKTSRTPTTPLVSPLKTTSLSWTSSQWYLESESVDYAYDCFRGSHCRKFSPQYFQVKISHPTVAAPNLSDKFRKVDTLPSDTVPTTKPKVSWDNRLKLPLDQEQVVYGVVTKQSWNSMSGSIDTASTTGPLVSLGEKPILTPSIPETLSGSMVNGSEPPIFLDNEKTIDFIFNISQYPDTLYPYYNNRFLRNDIHSGVSPIQNTRQSRSQTIHPASRDTVDINASIGLASRFAVSKNIDKREAGKDYSGVRSIKLVWKHVDAQWHCCRPTFDHHVVPLACTDQSQDDADATAFFGSLPFDSKQTFIVNLF